jgi:hypothetical protein
MGLSPQLYQRAMERLRRLPEGGFDAFDIVNTEEGRLTITAEKK